LRRLGPGRTFIIGCRGEPESQPNEGAGLLAVSRWAGSCDVAIESAVVGDRMLVVCGGVDVCAPAEAASTERPSAECVAARSGRFRPVRAGLEDVQKFIPSHDAALVVVRLADVVTAARR
jgi:hypothetical protein